MARVTTIGIQKGKNFIWILDGQTLRRKPLLGTGTWETSNARKDDSKVELVNWVHFPLSGTASKRVHIYFKAEWKNIQVETNIDRSLSNMSCLVLMVIGFERVLWRFRSAMMLLQNHVCVLAYSKKKQANYWMGRIVITKSKTTSILLHKKDPRPWDPCNNIKHWLSLPFPLPSCFSMTSFHFFLVIMVSPDWSAKSKKAFIFSEWSLAWWYIERKDLNI